jgi:hypothetical protein
MIYFKITFFTSLILFSLLISSCNQIGRTENSKNDSTTKENETQNKEEGLSEKKQDKNNQPFVDKTDNLDFLKTMNGKYSYEIKLLDNPILTKRLKKLLGNRYSFLKETWSVETPIEVKDNIFSASACEAHNCASTNFIIIIDFSKNVLYAGVRENDIVKTYSEDGSNSQKLNEFAEGNF